MSTPANYLAVYTDLDGAETCVAELKDTPRIYERVALSHRTVRAFGAVVTVYVVGAWYTAAHVEWNRGDWQGRADRAAYDKARAADPAMPMQFGRADDEKYSVAYCDGYENGWTMEGK